MIIIVYWLYLMFKLRIAVMVFGVCYTVTPAYVIVLIIYEITAFLFNC